jgi:folate-dependent phosphoribosylglycinamide formyltransferase PurN
VNPIPLFKPTNEPMRVACFLSRTGTNARKIIESSFKPTSGYKVVLIFTDTNDNRKKKDGSKICKAKELSKKYGIEYRVLDILDFYFERGYKNKRDLTMRPEYDKLVLKTIESYNLDIIALAGYMSIITDPLLNKYKNQIINVHPADLSIIADGSRKYVGMHAVKDAILAGEQYLRSTTHIVRKQVDYGEILVRSKPIQVQIPSKINVMDLQEDRYLLKKVVETNQNLLKKKGDWIIYPLTLKLIAEGRFSIENGKVYFNNEPVSKGYTLE